MDNRKRKKAEEILNDPILDTPAPLEAEIAEPTPDAPSEPLQEPTIDSVEVPNEEPAEGIKAEPEPVQEPKRGSEDWKEKFSNSSREAMALHFKNEKLQSVIQSVSDTPDPTIDELKEYARTRGVEYDDLDDFSKGLFKDTYINSKSLERIKTLGAELKESEAWNKRVDDFVNDPETVKTFPSLSDYEEEFKKYCAKPSRRGSELSDLVASFLYMQDKAPQAPKHKGSLLLSGGNGQAEPAKPSKLTELEVASIRIRDPKEYRRLIKSGKINVDL